MRRITTLLSLLALMGLVIFLWITSPARVDPKIFVGLSGDVSRGEAVFWATGCASCHVAPKEEVPERPVLTGGQAFKSDFGTFFAPNISSDPQFGIGGWSLEQFANAVQQGVSPEGQHYYPAFPYTAYSKMAPQDVVDLKAFIDMLPASPTENRAHNIGFPFNIRRSLGGWKFLFANTEWVVADASSSELERGRYLVEALGHCGECHTPRNKLGGLKTEAWLTGAPVPGGKGKVPDITPQTLTWSTQDLAYYFETGFTPDFDSVGGHMAEVVRNLSRLPASDREAIAAYLKALTN